MQTTFFTSPSHIPDPAKAKADLDAKLAKLRAGLNTAPVPAPETFTDAERAVVVKFDDLPAFYAKHGITRVTVDFPVTGPYAGQMVVRRCDE